MRPFAIESDIYRMSLAQTKNANPLKLCVLGFFMVLMTIDILILAMDASLAPDDVTSKSILAYISVPEQAKFTSTLDFDFENRFRILVAFRSDLAYSPLEPKYRLKIDFDVTSSGANEASMAKIRMSIVISTIKNPKTQSFRGLAYLSDDGKTYEIKDQLDPVSIKLNHERFITGAHDSTLKPLSIELQRILRFLHGHFRRYCYNITGHDKINRFFSIQNTFRVVPQLNTVQNKRSEIFCADFSSLFTNLPHNVVKEKLYYLIDLMFKNAGSEYIVVQGTNVRYDRNNSSTSGRSYHKNDLKGIIEFILRNSFAYYGGNLYQQHKGIPQGNNASPQIADLTLAVMEYQYIRNNIQSGHPLSFSLNRTFRYIDDLFHISDKKDEFIRITTDMYHHSLTLEQTNTGPKESAFLDMSIKVTNTGAVQTSLYNKTDDYSFSVVRYPHYESNIPISMGLNTLHGEIIRIFRNCSLFEHFLERTRQLARYFLQIQYPKEILCSRLYSTLNKTLAISLKYVVCNNDICMHIIEKL
ncbi:hypothetical protein PRIPAC_74670 [Pristionchus pacificus]|uniref:Reverse transcriptase domain-containing protein n=1 Tax=Pristionchus pacificus TaxID=54126 RepID=A0A2A6BZI2_PRIPA|nr:hypothetical protein PRIPAC_74670 [Pristionchus pacificus]|eukprot:PDM71256.1 hypothetical protein PRIPAC_37663 [Pristionchus pacificus]